MVTDFPSDSFITHRIEGQVGHTLHCGIYYSVYCACNLRQKIFYKMTTKCNVNVCISQLAFTLCKPNNMKHTLSC